MTGCDGIVHSLPNVRTHGQPLMKVDLQVWRPGHRCSGAANLNIPKVPGSWPRAILRGISPEFHSPIPHARFSSHQSVVQPSASPGPSASQFQTLNRISASFYVLELAAITRPSSP